MNRLCEEIFQKLNIYEKNYTQYTKCLCRNIEILISNKPEEKIRQIFLYFLINHSGLFPDKINLKVEYNNLDIAIYKNFELEDFRPSQPPIAIVEVKREGENLQFHEKQILRYLNEQRSPIGILFNGNDLILLKKSEQNSDFSSIHLKLIEDVPDILQEVLDRVNSDLSEFEKARNNDVDSFVYLIKKYGKYAVHKCTFLLKGRCDPITGCFFSYDEKYIYYTLYGKYSKKKSSRFHFEYRDFDKLISIIY